MKRLALRPPALLDVERPAGRILIAAIAIMVVVILTPLTVRPLLQEWTAQRALPTEAWPTPPATYAAPTAVPALQRSMPTATPLPTPQWEELGYLVSIQFTASTVVTKERTAPLLGLGIVADRLLLMAVGKVQAGVDLRERQISIDGRAIQVVLPKPQITSVELLPEQSRIYSREQVIGLSLLADTSGIEKDALETAKQQLHDQIANNTDMMTLAEEFARLQISNFLRDANFEQIEIRFE
jgi:hypothetical protein